MEIKTAQQKKNGNIFMQLEVNLTEYNSIIKIADNESVPVGADVIPKTSAHWTNEKPKTIGLFFRSNPGLQQEISQQIVFKMDNELWTYHPKNEQSKRTKINDMPNSFLWIQVPIPEHWKIKLDYDKP